MCLKKQKVFFYLPEGALFDATEHYCQLIKEALDRNANYDVHVVRDLDELTEEDFLVTIRLFDVFDSKVKPKKLIHWFQGIAPEEKIMISDYSLRSRITSLRTCFYERKVLKKADLCFFVSDKMRRHYESKYFLNVSDKCIVMPCYNLRFSEEVFSSLTRYDSPSFVYAGSASKWQCIEETLLTFKCIQEKVSDARLKILTKDSDTVLKLINKHSVRNVQIGYVELANLQAELGKYKYGFLLRKDDVVNNVATPTKMNSYLAAGLIPIYTTCIDSFEKNIDLEKYTLKFEEIEFEKIAQSVEFFEQKEIKAEKLGNIYKRIFDTYYNDEMYIEKISNKLKSLFYER